MIQIALVEDDEKERRHLKECLAFLSAKENVQFNITEFVSGLHFIGSYKPLYDIVLMDIEMPGMNGMETARELRKIDQSVILIFVTALAQYALQGYDVDALSYMLKPVNQYDFAMKMVRALNRCTRWREDSVSIRTDRENFNVRVSDIRYLEVIGHHVIYHTNSGSFEEYSSLKEAKQKIMQDYFVHCNRCYFVNLRYVTEVKDNVAWLGKDALAISRPQKKEFMAAFSNYIGGIR